MSLETPTVTPQSPRHRDVLAAVTRAVAADPALERFAFSPQLESLSDLTIGEFLEAIRAADERSRQLSNFSRGGAVEMRTVLSNRELGVVRLLVEGLSNKEISARLSLSDKTVKNHISHILAKLKLTARTQVAVMALRGGLA